MDGWAPPEENVSNTYRFNEARVLSLLLDAGLPFGLLVSQVAATRLQGGLKADLDQRVGKLSRIGQGKVVGVVYPNPQGTTFRATLVVVLDLQ